ncbi:hypothetical protein YC2023_066025 [Brassica napus]
MCGYKISQVDSNINSTQLNSKQFRQDTHHRFKIRNRPNRYGYLTRTEAQAKLISSNPYDVQRREEDVLYHMGLLQRRVFSLHKVVVWRNMWQPASAQAPHLSLTRRKLQAAEANSLSKGSIGHAFTVRIRTENQNQTSFYPFVPHEISVLVELILGHLHYLLTDVPPQPISPPDNVLRPDRPAEASLGCKRRGRYPVSDSRSK